MKILILAGEGAIRYMRLGYARVLGHIGHKCLVWHPSSGKPTFDIFDEFEPDVVFCGGWEIDRALFKNLMKRPNIKIILWGGNWGDFDREIDYKVDPVLRITQQEQDYISPLVKNNSIQYVFSYYHQNWVNVTHNHWRNIGLEPIGLPLAADLLVNSVKEPLDSLRCDVSFVGGMWPYKGLHLTKYLLPLCYPDMGLNVKIFGYGSWGVAQHLGIIEDEMMPHLFSSSIINLNVFEPLASKYGFDVNERCYKVLACGGFCVSEHCDSAANDIFTSNEIVFYKNFDELKKAVRHYLRHPEERLPYIQRGLSAVKINHNYFVRTQALLNCIDVNNEQLNNIVSNLGND